MHALLLNATALCALSGRLCESGVSSVAINPEEQSRRACDRLEVEVRSAWISSSPSAGALESAQISVTAMDLGN